MTLDISPLSAVPYSSRLAQKADLWIALNDSFFFLTRCNSYQIVWVAREFADPDRLRKNMNGTACIGGGAV
jgi:hypothetical protein